MHLSLRKSQSLDYLLLSCKKNKGWAQRELFIRYSGLMLALCQRYVQQRYEAEEIMIKGFAIIFDKISQFKNMGSFEGWMKKIMVNESLIYLRKNKSMYLMTDIEQASHQPDLDSLHNTLEVEDLVAIIQELPVGYRTVFNLYAIEGYSHREIAELLQVSVNTSKSQLSRARKVLQKSLLKLEQSENLNVVYHESN